MRSVITSLSRLVLGIALLAAFGWSPARAQSQSLFGLEAFYPFDDGRNPTADVIDKHHGRLIGGVRFVGGGVTPGAIAPVFGNVDALEFNGVRGYVEVPDHPHLRMARSFSISAWVKIARDKTEHIMVAKDQPGPATQTNYTLSIHEGRIRIALTIGDGAIATLP